MVDPKMVNDIGTWYGCTFCATITGGIVVAKKKTEKPKVVAQAKAESDIRHIQIQLPVDAYERGKAAAKANGLSMSAYVRQAVLKQIRTDTTEGAK